MEPTALADPILVSPRREQRADPGYLVLDWEPVAGADRYTVEIASDAAFEDVVAVVDAGRTSEVTLTGVLPADNATYFWRVLAHAGSRTSAGERVESFIARDAADMRADAAHGVPRNVEAREDLGPAAQLLGSAASTAASEATGRPDDAWADELSAEGVEPEGIASGQILGISLAVLVSLFVIAIVVYNWNTVVANQAQLAAASTALNPNAAVPRYPVLAEAERNAANALTGYEVLDAASGTYRIPIDQAIQLMANRYAGQAAGTAGDGGPADSAPADSAAGQVAGQATGAATPVNVVDLR